MAEVDLTQQECVVKKEGYRGYLGEHLQRRGSRGRGTTYLPSPQMLPPQILRKRGRRKT